MVKQITVRTRGQGLYDFTGHVAEIVREAGCIEGLCTVMVQHTSASLIIQEKRRPLRTPRLGELAQPPGPG